jgi:hypothetical protein
MKTTTYASGDWVTFTATPHNTGEGTVAYAWIYNGVKYDTWNQSTKWFDELEDGDVVACEITVTDEVFLTTGTAVSNEIMTRVYINEPAPSVTITSNVSEKVCYGTYITFTATTENTGGGDVTYQWNHNGTPIGGNQPTYTSSELYNGQVVSCDITVTDAACFTSATASSNIITADIFDRPEAGTIDGTPEIYIGNTVKLNVTGNDRPGTWGSYDESLAIVDQTGNVTGVGAGSTTIVYLVEADKSCPYDYDVAEFVITVLANICTPPVPTFTESPASPQCIGNEVTYTTQPDKTSYVWNIQGTEFTDYEMNSGGTTLDNTVTLTWLTEGSKTVTVNYTEDCEGETPASSTIMVNPMPTAFISYGGSPYCASGTASVTFKGNTGGIFEATPAGLAINAATGEINLEGSLAGTYTVTYNFSDGTCSVTTSETVTINPLPEATFEATTSSKPICEGEDAEFNLTGTAGAIVTYKLNDDLTTSTVTLDPSTGLATVTIPGVTTNLQMTLVSVSDGSCNKVLSETATVTVDPLPEATFASHASNISVCPGEDALFHLTGTVGAVVTFSVNGGANEAITLDGSGSAIVTISGAAVSQTMRLLNVKNNFTGCSKNLTESATVLVEDKVPPVVVTKNITVQLDETGHAIIAEDAVNDGSWDACGGLTFDTNITSFDCSNTGVNKVVLTVTDNNGNSAIMGATVLVEDKVPPVVVTKNITVQLDETGHAIIAEDAVNDGSRDACGGLTFDTNITSFDCSNTGVNKVVLTVTDNNGNSAIMGATVLVEDKVPPVVVTKNITVQLDETGHAIIAEDAVNDGSRDACGGITFDTNITSFDCSNTGVNKVVLTVTDNNGNSAIMGATVLVEDKVPPVVVTKNITVQLDETGHAIIAEDAVNDGSRDACGGLTFDTNITSFDCSNTGVNKVILTVTDNNGNSAIMGATVLVEDKVPPVVVTKNITVQLDETGHAIIAEDAVNDGSRDACGGLTFDTNITSFDCSNTGVNKVVLTVTDNNGNSAIMGATVLVEDKVPPVVVTKNITVQLDETGHAIISPAQIDDGSTDACGIASRALDVYSFDCNDVDIPVKVLLTVTDVNGNSASKTAMVTVEDNIAPALTCPSVSPFTRSTDLNCPYYTVVGTEFDATATDACCTPTMSYSCLNASVTSGCTLAGVQLPVGTHLIDWTAEDLNGNKSTGQIEVTVQKRSVVLTYTGDLTEQYSDETSLSAKLADETGTPVSGKTIRFTIGTQSVTDITGENGIATATLKLDQSPVPAYSVKTEFEGDDTSMPATDEDLFDIIQENATTVYTGQEFVGEQNPSLSVTPLTLSASVTDINDSYRGDIRNARVQFYDVNTLAALSGWLTPGLVLPGDQTEGVVVHTWNAPVPASGYNTFTVGVRVGTQNPEENGYYTGADKTVVNVYRTDLYEFISGGGHIIPADSKGTYASDPGPQGELWIQREMEQKPEEPPGESEPDIPQG